MATTVEFGHDPELLAGFESTTVDDCPPDDREALEAAAMYQQIADRRAQLENADVLRRARSL